MALQCCIIHLLHYSLNVSNFIDPFYDTNYVLQYRDLGRKRDIGGGGKKQYFYFELIDYAVNQPEYDLKEILIFHSFSNFATETKSPEITHQYLYVRTYLRMPLLQLLPMFNIS